MMRFLSLLLFPLAALLAQAPPISIPPLPVDLEKLDKPPTLTLPSAATQPAKPPAPAPAPVPDAAPALREVKPSSLSGPQPTSSTSAEGTFIIHGGDLNLRTTFCHDCEEIAADLQRLLRDPRAQEIPVVIVLKTPTQLDYSRPPVVAEPRQIPGGFHLQLTVQARQGLTSAAFRTELLKLLIAERILRGHKEVPDTSKRIMPDWVTTGILEALDFKNRIRPSALFAAIFKSGKIYGIEDILDSPIGQMDSFTETIYRTSAAALVMMLLDQPEGNLRFSKFLNELPVDTRSDRELLSANFPNLAADKANLDKWWALKLANLSRPSVFENMSAEETVSTLQDALTFRVSTETTVTLGGSSAGSSSGSSSKPKAEEKAETPAERPSMFSRLFGKRGEDADDAAEEKPKAKKGEAPKQEKASAEKPVEEKKPKKQETAPSSQSPTTDRPGLLDRLFKKGEKPEEAKEKPSKAQEEKSAALPYRSSQSLAQAFATAQQQGVPVLAQLSLFRKKTDAEKAQAAELESKEAAVKAAKKEAATKEAAAKAAAKELAKREAEVNDAKEKALKEAARAQKEMEEKKAKEEKTPPAKKEEEDAPAAKEKPAPAKPSEPKTVTRTTMSPLPVEEYAKVLKRPDAKTQLTQMMNSLAALNPRAHPFFRPIIKEYILVLADITSGKTKDVDARLAKLKQDTEQTLAKCKAAQKYMDWYQANNPQPKETSHFEEFLNMKEIVKKELKPRTDPITLYYDEWERSQKKAKK